MRCKVRSNHRSLRGDERGGFVARPLVKLFNIPVTPRRSSRRRRCTGSSYFRGGLQVYAVNPYTDAMPATSVVEGISAATASSSESICDVRSDSTLSSRAF